MKILLCSDLHISNSEKDYSLSVLHEIIGLCKNEKCETVLFAGDVFDSWADAESLRGDFRDSLEKLPQETAVYFLPGNHEELRMPERGKLETFDFGRAKLLTDKPYSLQNIGDDVELLVIPFQKDYSEYREWKVPPKKKTLRILLAHGLVSGFAYTGPGEDSDSVLDEEMFTSFEAGIAALGHIHGFNIIRRGETIIAYPGSARVWREGEEGPRKVIIISTEDFPPRLESRNLNSAGEYKVIPVYVSPGGELKVKDLDKITKTDYIRLDVSGVVEDETSVIQELEKLKQNLQNKCRKLTSGTDNLSVLTGISTHPLALRFLQEWEKAAGSYINEQDEYELARIKGLRVLKEILENRK